MKRNLRLEFLLTIKKPLRIKGFFWLSTDSETALKLIYAIFQNLARFEAWHIGFFDFDGCTSLRVSTVASGTFFYRKCSETYQGHRFSGLECTGDTADHGVEGFGCCCLWNVGRCGDCINKFGLVHFLTPQGLLDRMPEYNEANFCSN